MPFLLQFSRSLTVIDRLPFVNFGDFDSLGVEVLVLARWGKGKKWDFLRILGGFVLKGSKMS